MFYCHCVVVAPAARSPSECASWLQLGSRAGAVWVFLQFFAVCCFPSSWCWFQFCSRIGNGKKRTATAGGTTEEAATRQRHLERGSRRGKCPLVRGGQSLELGSLPQGLMPHGGGTCSSFDEAAPQPGGVGMGKVLQAPSAVSR